ncbi:MAG TPA: hypothetical protein VHE23_01060 [Candidatus Acidoferrales bacterium]|nr:hypothetical protein [Candidatus Acidoferrales bacterium]
MVKRVLSGLTLCILVCSGLAMAQGQSEVVSEVKHDISPALRDIPHTPPAQGIQREIPLRRPHPPEAFSPQPDPALQVSAGPLVTTTAGLNFVGVGVGLANFSDCCAPPDTNGAVGATQFVQWVNLSFAVFDKTTGALAAGFPKAGNTIWSGFGGSCETRNDGDPIAQYDKAAGRWVLAQPVFASPFSYCIAVSTTSDATGSYNRYQFSMPNFPDYPKLGVWSDGYYASFNMFSGNTFVGARACAFNRTAMLAGAAATAVCFQNSSSVANLLPSDLDGATAPPAGSPNFFVRFASNSLNLFRFHVDFATPANSTFTGPVSIPVAAFSPACNGGACIPQPGTSQKLDSLADRLMYRLAYRNFGTSESLVVNHSVFVSGNKHSQVDGIRWYEIRNPNGTPTVFQQGTFSPDSNSRWMGSIAMDKVGDIAVGYSVSSSSTFPSIRFTGRVPTDALGTLEAENTIQNGGGSQLTGLNRWGDYSSIAIDPVDDCTFWYTTEYLMNNGTFNWSTRIASFKFPGCQ